MSNRVDRESGSWGDPMWFAITVGLSTASSLPLSSAMSVQSPGNNAGDKSRSAPADNWLFSAPPHSPLLPASETTTITSADTAAPRVSASVTTTEGVAAIAHVAASRESGSTGASPGTSQAPLTTGCRSCGSISAGTFTDGSNDAVLDSTELGDASALVVRGERATTVVALAVAITDFMTMFTRDGDEVDNGGAAGGGVALAVPPVAAGLPRLAPLSVGGILETTSRIGGDTDPLATDDREPPWLAGEEISSARDDLRASPEVPDGSARSLMGTVLGMLPGPAGRARTGWQLVGDDEEAVVAAVKLPLKMNVSRCCGSLLVPLLPAVLHMEGEIIWPPGTCNVLEGTSATPPAGWEGEGCILGIASAASAVVGRVESHVVGEEQEEEGIEEEEEIELATRAPAESEEAAAASDGVAID